MSQWRTFIGLDVEEPDIVVEDQTHPDWATARDWLARHVEETWLADPDECPVCRDNAQETAQGLAALAPEESYCGFIDGWDYALLPVT